MLPEDNLRALQHAVEEKRTTVSGDQTDFQFRL